MRGGDGITYFVNLADCNGANALIRAAQSCLVPFASLRTTPFSLQWGAEVYAKVTAINAYGTSASSEGGNGARIQRVPDVPIGLANVATITTGTQIGLTWSQGVENGGTLVIDYTIQYD